MSTSNRGAVLVLLGVISSQHVFDLVVNLSLKAMHFCYNDVAALLQNTFRIWGKKDGGAAFWHLIGRLKKGCQRISHKQPNSGNFGVK